MRKTILTTAVVFGLGAVSLFAQNSMENNYETYNSGGNKVQFEVTKEMTNLYDLSNSKASVISYESSIKTAVYDATADIYN